MVSYLWTKGLHLGLVLLSHYLKLLNSGVASSISEGDIFIYLCSAQLTSFEINLISKEINCAEREYMNMPPSLIELATPQLLNTCCLLVIRHYLMLFLTTRPPGLFRTVSADKHIKAHCLPREYTLKRSLP